MINVLISLIGDQNAPNMFLIKDRAFQHIDRYLFITTSMMEQKRKLEHLLAATGISADACRKIIVSADNILDIHNKLDGLALDREHCRYYINLTGGTKLMSISLFAYFSQPSYQAEIYYVPVGKNTYQCIFPFSKTHEEKLTYQVDLVTYLAAYGFEILPRVTTEVLPFSVEDSNTLMEAFLHEDGEFRKIANTIREHYNRMLNYEQEKSIPVAEVAGLTPFLESRGLPAPFSGRLGPAYLHYLTGGWFEQWVYHRVRSHFELSPEKIAVGVSIYNPHTGNENEVDLLFIHDNTLFVLECKSGLGNYRQVRQLYGNALYRLDALRQKFGMNVNAGFLTLSDKLRDKKGRRKKAFAGRASAQNILVLDQYDLLENDGEWPEVFRFS